MPASVTPNLGLTLPTIMGDASIWGQELNGNFSILDAVIGSIPTRYFNPWGVPLSTANIDSIIRFTGASGDQDIYTVPAGKRGTVCLMATNIGLGTVTQILKIKINGVYYQFRTAVSHLTNTALAIANPFINYPLLDAGETFAINYSAPGMLVTGFAVTFNPVEPLVSGRNLALVSGSNVVYTCPAGKRAFPMNMNPVAGISQLLIWNGSIGSRTVKWQLTPNGGSPQDLIVSASLNANTLQTTALMPGLASGDVLSAVTDSSASGQFAYIPNILEWPV